MHGRYGQIVLDDGASSIHGSQMRIVNFANSAHGVAEANNGIDTNLAYV
jgi:hypothetical protein